MSKTPFMPLWVSDFLGDTLDLDATEVGAYMLLLMAQWQRGGKSLPTDDGKLQRIARCGRNWGKVWANLDRYFKADDDGIYSPRLRLEAQNVAAKREVNAHNGARGGKAKALKTQDQALANATETLQRNPSIPEPEPYREEREPIGSLAIVVSEQPNRFPEFWDQYPHRNGAKKGKAAAEKAWAKAIKARASPDQIIAGAMRYASDRQVIEGYAKDPATWLNAKGWEDEIERSDNRPRPSGAQSGTVAAFAAIAARRSAATGGY